MMSLERYPPPRVTVASPEEGPPWIQVVVVPAIGCDGRASWFSEPSDHWRVPDIYSGFTKRVTFYRPNSRETTRTDKGLDSYATEFLQSLCSNHELLAPGAPPIHFACHSTGGLVLKSALLMALDRKHTKNQKSSRLLEKNHISVAFFGVPHRGSAVLADGDLQGGIEKLLGLAFPPSQELLEQLKPENPYLRRVHNRFLKEIAPKCRKIWSFYEELLTPLSRDDNAMPAMKMIVESNSAFLQEANAEELKNNRNVQLPSTHDKLVDGKHIRMGINDYINDLRCLRDETEFHVQIAEFKPGERNRSPKDFARVPLHVFLNPESEQGSKKYLPKLKDKEHTLRWVHVSCNNMVWVADVLRAVSDAVGSGTDLTTTVLDEEVWKTKQHKPHHRSPYARHMTPLFRAFLPEEDKAQGKGEEKEGEKEEEEKYRPSDPQQTTLASQSREHREEETRSDHMRPKSVSFLPSPAPKAAQMVLYMPYLHWDTSEYLTFRDRIIQCRSKVQYYQEEMSKVQDSVGDEGFHWGELVPSPFPASAARSSSGKKTETDAIQGRIDFEHMIEEFLNAQKSRRHQLLYNYCITSDAWDGALHPMRSLQQYGFPFMEEAYHRCGDSEQEGEGKGRDKEKRKVTGRGSHNTLTYETGEEEIKPAYAKAFEATKSRMEKQKQLPVKRVKAAKTSDPKEPSDTQEPPEIKKVLMVDQLWIWVINSDTIVTFFPSNASEIDHSQKTPGDLYHHIRKKLTNHPHYPARVYTVFDLMALIVLTSASIMLDASHRHRALSHYIDVFAMYERRISNSSWKDPEAEKPSNADEGGKRSKDEEIGRDGYTSLLGIKTELEILLQLLAEQLNVIDDIKLAHPWIHKTTSKAKALDPSIKRDHTESHHPFLETVEQRVVDYENQMQSLHKKCVLAIEMYTALYDMIHTRKLVDEAESAHRSSDMLMVFTVITVIFAPLTFLAGLFGVAAVEWDVKHQNLSLQAIMLIIFLPSAAITAVGISIAFRAHGRDRKGRIAGSPLAGLVQAFGKDEKDAAAQEPVVESDGGGETTGFDKRWRGLLLNRRRRGTQQETIKDQV